MTGRITTTDVLVIGGGLAGERCAIEAAAAGHDVLILSLVPPRRSHSCAAQGGMQAALGNCVKAEGDNPDVHYLDTVRGSDWGADQEVARIFADNAPIAVRELAHFGVPWTRVKGGRNSYFIKGERVEIDEALENDGLIMHRDFGGTAKWRACYAGAGTGHSALYAVDAEVVRLGVTVRDRAEAVELIHDGSRCYGTVSRCLRTGEHSAVLAKATVIATGGHGRIYGQYTTNATINEGMGAAIALNTGVVPLGNMEAVQFHPTALSPSGILVTEGCRGDGGFLLDKDGYRFMVDAEPEKQELASRDVVSRHMAQRMRDGYGVETKHGPHLWLDVRQLGDEHLRTKLREVWEICRDFVGLDPAEELIPVRPTQHYSMGGVRVNKEGEAYNMAGLFAVGEASCWDMHGFNRLGGNSLAETIVSGRLVGRRIAKTIGSDGVNVETSFAFEALQKAEARAAEILAREGEGKSVYEVRDEMAEVMIGKVGIFRNGDELAAAVEDLRSLLDDCDGIVLRSNAPGMNPELTFALRLKNMVRLAYLTAKGALARTESRGAHFRTDFPLRDDAKWLNRTLARWPDTAAEPDIGYEPVGVLDVPPGHRGYGADDRVEMDGSIDDYNAQVEEQQQAAGKLPVEGVFVNDTGRRLTFEIFRFNPLDPDSKPHMQTYEIDEVPYMSLFMALNEIRETQDPSLQFDFACRSAICGSCGMMVNGVPSLSCRTQTADLPDVIRMHPLPVFELVGDLSVDTGTWFREMVEKSEAWIHAKEAFDPDAIEDRMDDELAQKIYDSDRCIECGCCVASCGVANVNDQFAGPAGLNRVARFAMDPRDTRSDDDWFEVISTDNGVFGCIGMMACHDVCPKELPLLEVYAYLRRKAFAAATN